MDLLARCTNGVGDLLFDDPANLRQHFTQVAAENDDIWIEDVDQVPDADAKPGAHSIEPTDRVAIARLR